jgi:hypothetical protein
MEEASKARSVTPGYFDRQKPYAVHLAQTFDHLPVSRILGGSHLLPGSGIHRRRKRQLDHARFPGAYLLDLHHVARRPRRPKFNWRGVISQVRSIAHSLLLDAAFSDSARHGLLRVRKAVARTLYSILRKLEGEGPKYFARKARIIPLSKCRMIRHNLRHAAFARCSQDCNYTQDKSGSSVMAAR